jgi:hypothetical protein
LLLLYPYPRNQNTTTSTKATYNTDAVFNLIHG